MFALKSRAAEAAIGVPSPLLSHVAGEFAAEIAGLWPAPHAVFLTTEAPRRHLLCLTLATQGPVGPHVAEAILHSAFKAAIALALSAPPPGLKRALEHMQEVAWPRAAYGRLLQLLRHPHAAKVLRHARRIDSGDIEALAALPAPMLEGEGARLGLNLHQARLACEVHTALVLRDGAEAADAAGRRWGGAASVQDALQLMQQDLTPALPPPPFVGTMRLRPLATHEAMRDAALRYRNCLRQCIMRAARGQSAYFEWLGDPRAVVEICRDEVFGWRLDQARLVDNRAVPLAAQREICAELQAIGVHVGRASWQLRDALDGAARARFELEPVERAVSYAFTDD